MIALCIVCLLISFSLTALFVANWLVSLRKNNNGFLQKKSKTLLSPFHLMVMGVFIALTVLFVPVYLNDLSPSSEWATYIKVPILAAQNALQLFVINAGFDNVRNTITSLIGITDTLADIYTVYMTFYFIVAPLLTGAVALSLVKGLYEKWRYFRRQPTKLYIMSELNENSLALAEDILVNFANRDEDELTEEEKQGVCVVSPKNRNDGKVNRTLVFAGVTSKFQEDHEELVAKAKALGAICLENDVTEISLKSSQLDIYRKLYLIAHNEDENVTKAMGLIATCRKSYNSPKTHLYVFSAKDESSILLDSVLRESEPKSLFFKVRLVNEKRNLIWNTMIKSRSALEELPLEESATVVAPTQQSTLPLIYQTAKLNAENNMREINVLIVGLGNYGIELVKTICWFCQMPGYRVNLYVFDKDKNCEEKLRAVAPDLVKKENNNISAELEARGEAYYWINCHNSALNVHEAAFADQIEKLKDITLAFVTLGDDNVNIDIAIKLRRLFGRTSHDSIPFILPVVYDSEKTAHLKKGMRFISDEGKKNPKEDYNIRFIGDTASRYSIANVEQLQLDRLGLACHFQWTNRVEDAPNSYNEYNVFEYNRRSSIAQAMLILVRKRLEENGYVFYVDNNGTGSQVKVAAPDNNVEVTLQDENEIKKTLAIYEHRRWNAFVRGDGFVLVRDENGKPRPRNNAAKIHNLLVPYDELEYQEQLKDETSWDTVSDYEKEYEKQMKEKIAEQTQKGTKKKKNCRTGKNNKTEK